jgi:O-antigen ligase
MMKSSSNPTLYRIQSTFQPSKDRSMATRLRNQAFIKPYIQTHPFGGGLGSTGVWGMRFSPNTPLAHFPPDSGYVRIAVELGWIGLLIYCGMLFLIMAKGIQYYIRVRDPAIKTIYAAIICVIFSLAVVNYTQEALILLPNSIIFYVFIAAIVKLKDFDPAYAVAEKSEEEA